MIHKQQCKDAVSLVDGGLILVSQDRPSLVYYLDEAGKSFDVVQFDSVPELKEKIKDPSVRWVVVRNFKNGYRDYEDIVSYMKSRKDFTLEYELEYVLLFKRATTYLNEQWDI